MNIAKKLAISMIFVLLLALPANAGDGVAKVIILKGNVQASTNDGNPVKLKKGMWLKEGAIVTTQAKSFAKLLFIDKSSMNIGPNSEMKIKEFPKSDAGIIQLMKGQIRSKVTKDYMNMKDKKKSKLFIKTKTAAMGVRGTDFQVNFNPINQATSLVTFEGNVVMAQLHDLANMAITQSNLEKIVSSDIAVSVKKGQYSGASPKTPRATLPIKISPIQLNKLESIQVPGLSPAEARSVGEGSKNTPPKEFRNIIPPGVDAKEFSNEAKEVDKEVSKTLGTGTVVSVQREIKRENQLENTPPPEGMVNPATGEIAPPAGGFIDLNTAQYIPPPEGSQFDPNAGVYIPPPSLGTVDPETGDFKNENFELAPDGSWEPKAEESFAENSVDNERAPASENEEQLASNEPKDKVFEGDPSMKPPADVEAVSVIGSDKTEMAALSDQLKPIAPPTNDLKLDIAPAGENGDQTKGSDRGIASVNETSANSETDGSKDEFNSSTPEPVDAEYGETAPEIDNESLEELANNVSEDIIESVEEDFDELQEQINQINQGSTKTDFNVDVQ